MSLRRDEETNSAEHEPCFVISIAAKLVNVHQQTLRYYERLGLLEPGRSRGNIRLYSMRDIQRAQQIRRLVDELGVNLAGVDVILNMTDRIAEMERQMEEMKQEYEAEIRRLRAMLGDV
ncbi:MAG: heat shock protein transcriptional repressor HspR [Chloroflexota bacterium]|jgi:MerR family transcriptional regulator/heat shock protein HspR